MQSPLQITFRRLPPADALEARIRARAAKLEEFFPRITGGRVVVQEIDRHRRQGKQFSVRVALRVPKHEFAVNRDHDEDAYVAVRDAFDAAERQLEARARLKRGDVKTRAAR